jgi:hypothetical protein
MLSDIVYGLGNQQEWGWLQDITIFNENHNAILFITQGVVIKKNPPTKQMVMGSKLTCYY